MDALTLLRTPKRGWVAEWIRTLPSKPTNADYSDHSPGKEFISENGVRLDKIKSTEHHRVYLTKPTPIIAEVKSRSTLHRPSLPIIIFISLVPQNDAIERLFVTYDEMTI
ncbi:hypothetical protein V9T40_005518 [Parthenolecanium corni]|uniref:Uncharacterized protein n=1 Tax=Parthenolecanium corni TaxID=536013 RepID=A0AAN9TIW7_9HEMI